jgi:hypothetical protein
MVSEGCEKRGEMAFLNIRGRLLHESWNPSVEEQGGEVMTIVAISREMGSGGYEIGAAVAKALHFEYVDRQILLQAAHAHGVPEAKLVDVVERRLSLWERFDTERRRYLTFLEAAYYAFAERGNLVTASRSGPFFVRDVTVFTKNRDRLLAGEIAQAFFDAVLTQARERKLLSEEHFTVDGTLIEAWAGQKSFKPKAGSPPAPPDDPGNPTVDFRGERRSNATHTSTTDPEARLYKKAQGQEAKLCYLGHLLMENRHGLAVGTQVTQATGTAEAEAALCLAMSLPGRRRVTVGGDKAYDTRGVVDTLRTFRITPHVAQSTTGRASAIDGRTTRHPGYAVSQRARKRVEEIFGWLKTVGGLRKTRHRGQRRVGWMFTFATAVYNLVRIRNLAPAVG